MLMVFLTTIAGFCFLKSNKKNNRLLIAVLLLSSLNEVITLLLQYYKQQAFIPMLYSISFPLFCLLWLRMLYLNQLRKNATFIFTLFFIIFWMINFIWFEGTKKFNFYTATVGSFGYIALFANESFVQLRKENFGAILSNTYLLLLSPVLLFYGFSQMFGFVSRNITQIFIIQNFKLFDLVTEFVNIVYYIIIVIYIILQYKTAANE